MAGGEPGALGENLIERADGTRTPLRARDTADVAPGDALVIRTPGGGAYGPPAADMSGPHADEPLDVGRPRGE